MEINNEKWLADLKAEMAEAQAILDAKAAQAKAKEQQLMAEKIKGQMSQNRVHEFNNNVIEKGIKYGLLDSTNYPKVYERTVKDLGQAKGQDLFIRTVIGLLSHEYTGVESSTFRIGNGGLTWRGQTYSSPQELYKGVLTLLHGEDGNNFDPIGGFEWFEVVLDSVLKEGGFWSDDYSHAGFSRRVQDLVRLVELSRVNPLGVPDASDLTTEDMFYINSVLGRDL
ncbi:MAG: hypothetical protein RMX96_13860 [Nostoc sp. ChiSLP02]|nr:hypothetical protein [Nostoc sp. DedSLP05]MDZ8098902.1 hypothetical protein [Nostoc sp. DedSLP01]MDZ8185922.1 hypothetical protein [Nostoc sp. ChiSLP02]